MSDDAPNAQLLIELDRALSLQRMYAPGDPAVKAGVAGALAWLAPCLAANGALELAGTAEGLTLDGHVVDSEDGAGALLRSRLAAHRVARLTLRAGLSVEELLALAALLMDGDTLRLTVVAMPHVAIDAAPLGPDLGAALPAPAATPEETAEAVAATLRQLDVDLPALAWQLPRLAPALREALFEHGDGPRGSRGLRRSLRACLLAAALRDPRRDAAGQLDALVDSDAERVRLAGAVADRLSSETLQRLLRLLAPDAPTLAAGGRSRGRLVLADPDEASAAPWVEMLTRVGYRVEHLTDGTAALEAIRAEPRPACVVLDLQLPGTTGLEIVSTLAGDDEPLPIVVASALGNVAESYEVKRYPRLRFLRKPVALGALSDAVDAIATSDAREPDADGPEQQRRARAVQAELLPSEIPVVAGVELGAHYSACRGVGGDYFDFLQVDARHVGLLVADVSATGLAGAQLMSMARTALRTIAPGRASPREVLQRANQLLHHELGQGTVLTAMYLVIDTSTGLARFACAGHNPALVYSRSLGFASFTKPSGIALGLVEPGQFDRSLEERLTLQPGDQLLMYTDGIVEAMNAAQEELGEQRLAGLVDRHQDCSTQELLGRIVAAVREHRGDAPQHDDMTLLGVRRLE